MFEKFPGASEMEPGRSDKANKMGSVPNMIKFMAVQICLAKGKANKMGSVPKPTSYIGPQFISGPAHCEILEVYGNGAVPMVVCTGTPRMSPVAVRSPTACEGTFMAARMF